MAYRFTVARHWTPAPHRQEDPDALAHGALAEFAAAGTVPDMECALNVIGGLAIDRGANALAVAQANAEKLGLSGQVRFLQGDLFAPVAGVLSDRWNRRR